MRKSTKLAVLIAILVAISSLTALAGWKTNAEGNWVYEDSNGDLVYNEFKKSDDGNYYYVGDDGVMVKDSIINYNGDIYYVDVNGKKVTSDWAKIPATDEDAGLDAPYRYYYLQASGKAYTSAQKTINGKKYVFDSNGKMVWGLLDSSYAMITDESQIQSAEYWYANWDQGWAMTDWYHYTASELVPGCGDDYWFYFKSGAKQANKNLKVNGVNYTFGETGIMQTGWGKASQSTSTETKPNYYNADGKLIKKDWQYIYADGESEDNGNSKAWFYFDSTGNKLKNKVSKINGKYYAFGDGSKMLSSLVKLPVTAGVTIAEIAAATETKAVAFTSTEKADKTSYVKAAAAAGQPIYFFSADGVNDGAMKTGTQKITLGDSEYTFVFAKNGQAYNGYNASTKKIYTYGILEAAGSSSRYTVVENLTYDKTLTALTDEVESRRYNVVGVSGAVLANGQIGKTVDGDVYAVRKAEVANKDANKYYIGFFYDSDYATSAAQAWVKGEATFDYGTVKGLKVATYLKKVWSNTEAGVAPKAE